MLFQSQEFVLLLLPITLALYYLFADRPRARQTILVVASLVFYGWWDARFVPLLLGHCTVAWAGPKLAKLTGRRVLVDIAIALQFLSLATFKYTGFLVANLEQTLGRTRFGSALPIAAGPRTDQDRSNVCIVASFVEVVQVQGIVANLVNVLGEEGPLSDLEFEDEDDRSDDDDRVDSAPHARNCEFEIDRACVVRQDTLKDVGLLEPCISLSSGEVKIVL